MCSVQELCLGYSLWMTQQRVSENPQTLKHKEPDNTISSTGSKAAAELIVEGLDGQAAKP